MLCTCIYVCIKMIRGEEHRKGIEQNFAYDIQKSFNPVLDLCLQRENLFRFEGWHLSQEFRAGTICHHTNS